MIFRHNASALALLLASTALTIVPSAGRAAMPDGSFVVAQQPEQKKPGEPAKPAAPPPRPQAPAAHPPTPPPQAPHPQPPRPQAPPPPPHPAAPPPQPHPAAPPPQAPRPPAAQPPRPAAPPPPVQERREPPRPAAPPPAVQERREPPRPAAPPPAVQERREPPRPPAAAPQQPPAAPPRPAPQAQPQPPAAPPAQRPAGQPPAPPAGQPPRPQTSAPPPFAPPPAAQRPGGPVPAGNPAAIAPPAQPRAATEFIRRPGQPGAPAPRIEQIRQQRQEVREGNRIIIREGDRNIIRENNRVIIEHNEASRFAVGARGVVTERRGANVETVVQLGNGMRIVNVVDANGRLLRRVRRDPSGREIIIIDNTRAPRFAGPMFLDLPPPVIRIPRERYILDADRADAGMIYGVLEEPPVMAIDEDYTLDQVRYNVALRDRMPRVDLDVNFDLGSWQLTPDQVDRLGFIAEGINRALQRNPREVFMIEGYTDATGNPEDNLSLSDRRAEAVAVALTEQFQVPPENLVTQGYGEEYLKVPTQAAERANRRVAVRRITPLIDREAANVPPPPPPR